MPAMPAPRMAVLIWVGLVCPIILPVVGMVADEGLPTTRALGARSVFFLVERVVEGVVRFWGMVNNCR